MTHPAPSQPLLHFWAHRSRAERPPPGLPAAWWVLAGTLWQKGGETQGLQTGNRTEATHTPFPAPRPGCQTTTGARWLGETDLCPAGRSLNPHLQFSGGSSLKVKLKCTPAE